MSKSSFRDCLPYYQLNYFLGSDTQLDYNKFVKRFIDSCFITLTLWAFLCNERFAMDSRRQVWYLVARFGMVGEKKDKYGTDCAAFCEKWEWVHSFRWSLIFDFCEFTDLASPLQLWASAKTDWPTFNKRSFWFISCVGLQHSNERQKYTVIYRNLSKIRYCELGIDR